MAFDGIVTKAISSELQQLTGARIDKIFQTNQNLITIGCYLKAHNYAFTICTNPQNYRVNLTTHTRQNPKVAPNFCMVLRKHLIGLHIKNIITNNLERVITIELEGFDDINDIISKKLIIELMGKHCNIILLNDENIIIDSLRHINNNNSTHIVIPHIKYTYPAISKKNFLQCLDFKEFYNEIKDTNLEDIPSKISNTYNGISKNFLNFIIQDLNITNLEDIYNYIKNAINRTDSLDLEFKEIRNDYFLIPSKNTEKFKLNFFIDDFYYRKENIEEFKSYRDSILKLILSTLNKYNKRLAKINEKLKECENMDKYRLYGELITANLYNIKNENTNEITLENYYNNNEPITIKLDPKYTPSINAKHFFKKYNKLKTASEVVSIQKKENLQELDYIQSIVYELENASSLEDITEIFDEVSENVIFKDKTEKLKNKKTIKPKKSNLTKNKNVKFNPYKYTIDNFTLLVGRNNKENDYLTLKYAKKTDIWFHTKDIQGSHGVLILDGKEPNQDLLIKASQIVSYHSKARLSNNVLVDYCYVKYVKKPKGAKPGMVIYTNQHTLNVNPKKFN